jgi:hypothetical protein
VGSTKRVFMSVVAAVGLGSLVFAVSAIADHGGRGDRGRDGQRGAAKAFFRASLAPSLPTDPAFHGVLPGGAPWRLARGTVRIARNGAFDVEVRGLVLTTTGDAGPVKTIDASLYCGADASTVAAATTKTVPLTSDGNAEIEDRVALPSTCLAPVVLVHPNGGLTRYIAVDGWRS